MSPEDRRLIDACLAGAGWEELARIGSPSIRAGARAGLRHVGLAPSDSDVDDIIQQVLLSLTDGRRLRSFQGKSKLTTWLSVMGFRTALNFVRQARRYEETRKKAVPTTLSGIRREELEEALQGLNPTQRAALRLYFLEGMNRQEIAEMLGMSPNSISSLIVRSLARAKSLAPSWRPSGV